MNTFIIDCKLNYQVMQPADFVFHIQVAPDMEQTILAESIAIEPSQPIQAFTVDGSNNRLFRLHSPVGPLSVRYQAKVTMNRLPNPQDAREMAINELPNDILQYLTTTRYCESDLLVTDAINLFGNLPMGYSRVQAITDWVKANIKYQLGSSNSTTTARDVHANRAGVCRDFAHLCITFCRALNIPARFVVGYCIFDEPPPDFHAVFEAYLDGKWMLFDPTGLAPVDRLVRVGTGRDAKDVAFATIFGAATMTSMSPEIHLAESAEHVELAA
jgi:transglutaminase-like putative cysteine protease